MEAAVVPFNRCKRVGVSDLLHRDRVPFTSALCTSQARAQQGTTSKEDKTRFFFFNTLQIKEGSDYRGEDEITAL